MKVLMVCLRNISKQIIECVKETDYWIVVDGHAIPKHVKNKPKTDKKGNGKTKM